MINSISHILTNRFLNNTACKQCFKLIVDINMWLFDKSLDNDGMSILFDSALRSVAASSANGIVSLTIYSLDGRIVGSIEGEGKESVSIDLSDIPTGVYIVTATDAKGVRKQMKIAR